VNYGWFSLILFTGKRVLRSGPINLTAGWFSGPRSRQRNESRGFCEQLHLLTSYVCLYKYIHTTHALSPKRQERHLRYSSETTTSYPNYLAMSNTADVTGGKPIAVWSHSISGVNAINPLIAFYDILGRKRGAFLLFCPGTTWDYMFIINITYKCTIYVCLTIYLETITQVLKGT
jgi:hypothetical protein